jgi:hypothetical protein
MVALAGLLAGLPQSGFYPQLGAPPAFHGTHDCMGIPQQLRISPLVFGTGLLQAGLQIVCIFDEGRRDMALFVTGHCTFAEVVMARYVP